MTDLRHTLTGINRSGERTPPHPGGSTFRYGPWHIARASWTKPAPGFDWEWHHEDYDGPEDGRAGSAATLTACINEINELEDEA